MFMCEKIKNMCYSGRAVIDRLFTTPITPSFPAWFALLQCAISPREGDEIGSVLRNASWAPLLLEISQAANFRFGTGWMWGVKHFAGSMMGGATSDRSNRGNHGWAFHSGAMRIALLVRSKCTFLRTLEINEKGGKIEGSNSVHEMENASIAKAWGSCFHET